jgi:hypothetical protein
MIGGGGLYHVLSKVNKVFSIGNVGKNVKIRKENYLHTGSFRYMVLFFVFYVQNAIPKRG